MINDGTNDPPSVCDHSDDDDDVCVLLKPQAVLLSVMIHPAQSFPKQSK